MIGFLPCDIFFSRGDTVLAKGIRVCSRTIGEARTKVNHVGAFVTCGNIREALVIEALTKVRKHTLAVQYTGSDCSLAAFRPKNLTPEQSRVIVDSLNGYEGRVYGYAKIVTHFLDWVLQGAYVFRRLTNSDRYPICSWVVAQSFSKAGLDFGVQPGAATPDDIWDFCIANPDKYEQVMGFTML